MQNKIKLNKMTKSYFKVPNRIHDIGLSGMAIAVYSYLAKQPEDFNPAVRVLARSLKISNTTAIKYMKELKDRNIIKVTQAGAENLITKYAFVPYNEWT
jgi:predicted DNA-binding transcriptional regulator